MLRDFLFLGKRLLAARWERIDFGRSIVNEGLLDKRKKPSSSYLPPNRQVFESQYFSGTNRRPFSVASSSYAPFVERFGIFTFSLGARLYGIRLNRCEMQLRRARFLSSECTMYQGVFSLSLASSIMSRARE